MKEVRNRKKEGGRREMEQSTKERERKKCHTKVTPWYGCTFLTEAYSALKLHSGSTWSSVTTFIIKQRSGRMATPVMVACYMCIYMYVMRKVQIGTILGLSCTNAGSVLCVGNPRIGQLLAHALLMPTCT